MLGIRQGKVKAQQTNPKRSSPNVEHEDVSRMLMSRRAAWKPSGLLLAKTYYWIDNSHTPDSRERNCQLPCSISATACKAYALKWHGAIGEASRLCDTDTSKSIRRHWPGITKFSPSGKAPMPSTLGDGVVVHHEKSLP
jgi:hypothetical protein